MKLKSIHPRHARRLWNPRTKAIVASALSLAALAACSKARNELSAADKASLPASAPSAPTEFVFPQASCGDRATTTLNQTWYPVFIDKGNVDEIRKKYCGDAASTVREKTGEPTVQVASFSSYEKALRFAKVVGGEVESTVGQTAPGSPVPRTAAATVSTAAKSGVLNAQEVGSPINIRSSASTAAEIQETGYAGDTVQIAEQKQGEDGNTWYRVKLTTGAEGWVRGDLVRTSGNTTSTSQTTAGHTAGATTGATATAPSEQRTAAAPSTPAPNGTIANTSTGAATTATSAATRQVVLTAQESGSPINIRSSASTAAEIQDVGYAGDSLEVAEKRQGEDGFTWYRVRSSAGTEGWVRGDFVSNN